jgi:hypothetical protein
MADEQVIEGVVRRVDRANATITIVTHGVRNTTLPFDLTPHTPDYATFIGRDVRIVVEDGKITSVTAL